jgi:hypothetical protein
MQELIDYLEDVKNEILSNDNKVSMSELHYIIKDKITDENKGFIHLLLSYYSLGINQTHKYRPASP